MIHINSLLITGGTGFFGKSILRYLINHFNSIHLIFNVTVLTRTPELFLKEYPEFANLKWLHLHRGDIMIFDSLPHDLHFTHVIHAAADSTFGPSLTPLQRYQQIVLGTKNMLDFAILNKVDKFLYTSSGAVYGVQPSNIDAITEDYHGIPNPLNANNAYGIAKRAAEHLCALYHDAHGLHTIIARCFAFVGRDLPLNVHFAIGNFIRDALYNDAIIVKSDGSPVRTYLDQSDLASWLLLLCSKGHANEAYNVGGNQPISIKNLAITIRDSLSPKKTIIFENSKTENSNRNLYIPDINKSHSIISPVCFIPLETTLKTFVTQP
jgi:UDP-glucuronate decarboxylase